MTNLNLKFYEQFWILNITNFNYSAMRTSTWQHDVFSSDPWVALARKEFHPNKKRSAIYLVSSHKFTPWAYLLCFVSKSQKHSGIESLTLVKPMELSFTVSVGAGGIISLFFENHWVLQVSNLAAFPSHQVTLQGGRSCFFFASVIRQKSTCMPVPVPKDLCSWWPASNAVGKSRG